MAAALRKLEARSTTSQILAALSSRVHRQWLEDPRTAGPSDLAAMHAPFMCTIYSRESGASKTIFL